MDIVLETALAGKPERIHSKGNVQDKAPVVVPEDAKISADAVNGLM
jgi:hypothetical protein